MGITVQTITVHPLIPIGPPAFNIMLAIIKLSLAFCLLYLGSTAAESSCKSYMMEIRSWTTIKNHYCDIRAKQPEWNCGVSGGRTGWAESACKFQDRGMPGAVRLHL